MSDQLTIEEVKGVARLARLALDEAHLAKYATQLTSILGYVEQLKKVDVSNTEPMAHALPISNVLREDIIQPSLPLEKVLQNAPDTDGQFFKVPKIIGGGEE